MALGFAETAKLAVDLSLKGNFNSAIATSQKSLKGLNAAITDTQGRAYKAGQQIGTGIRRGVAIAAVAFGSLGALLLQSAKEGQRAADVQAIYANAIAKSGKITAAYVTQLNAQSLALSNLTGMDDEQIKSEQTRLIQMKLNGAQILKLLPLILDAAKSTGRDIDTVTLAVGRAVQGHATSLGKLGIIIPKTAKKSKDSFGDVVKALKAFEGTNQALSGSLEVKLGALRERLQDVREEAGMKLLPALVRITDVVAQKLVPAFGEFIQSILPGAIEGLNKVADFLASGGAAKTFSSVFATIKTAAPILQKTAEATLGIVKAAVELFTSLPPGLQQLAVTAFAVNKLTGGLVTNVVGGIAQFLAKSFTGNMNVTAGVVNVVGAGGVGGALSAAGSALPAAAGIASASAIALAALPFLLLALPEVINPGFRGTPGFTGPVSPKGQRGPSGLTAEGNHPKGTKTDPLHVTAPGLANPILDRGGREAGRNNFITQGGFDSRIATAVIQGFQRMIAALKSARGTEAIRAAVREAVDRVITKSTGNASNTERTVSALRSALSHTHDPVLQREIRAAIGKVQAKLPGREFAARQLAKADKLINDGKVTRTDLKQLQSIERALKDRGLPHAAAQIQAKIDAAKRAQVAATHASASQITSAIAAQDLSVTVKNAVNVSLRAFGKTATISANFSGGGGGKGGKLL